MKNSNKLVITMLSALAIVASAHAEAFVPGTHITALEGAATSAGTIVAALVALGAGLMIYKKVRGYFSSAK